jgi:hypothetical protein
MDGCNLAELGNPPDKERWCIQPVKTTPRSAVREIRQRFVGIALEDYARLCGLSKTTLMNIKRDDPRVLLESVKKALKPPGDQLSPVPAEDL